MQNRVKVGTCSGPAEAAFVRSVFDAHEVPVVINGEMHASAMGGLGGFIQLEIFVDSEDAEEASALLRDIRAGEHALSEDELPEAEPATDDTAAADPDRDERADAEGVWVARGAPRAADPPAAAAAPTTSFDNRRRRVGIVLLVSMIAGFGTAHMATGAWKRGAVLAGVTVAGIALAVQGDRLGGWLLFAARFVDLLGAAWRAWSPRRPRA